MKFLSLISSLKNDLAQIFERHKTVCLWLSGGADSLLLLQILLEAGREFMIFRFDDGWTREQRRRFDQLTIKHRLQVFSYPAVSHSLVSENGEIALVSEYAIGGGAFVPVVRDIVPHSSRCAFDIKLPVSRFERPPIYAGAHIFGIRQAERHFIFGASPILTEKSFELGASEIFAPLLKWKKSQIFAALKTFGISYEKPAAEADGGNVPACVNCLTDRAPFCPKKGEQIQPVENFDGAENLKIFRARLGLIQE